MVSPVKNTQPRISSYMVFLRYALFIAFIFALMFLIAKFGDVAEA